jgi:hypothetical protein
MIELSVMGVRTERCHQRRARHRDPRGDGSHRVTRQAARDLSRSYHILGSFLLNQYPTGGDSLSR